MSLSEGTGAGVDCEEQIQGSTPAPEGREAVARALYLSMVREVFALSAASSTARPHAESIDGAAVLVSSAVPSVAVGDWEASSDPPADGSAVLTVTQRDGLSRLARCVDCGHGLVEGERCGGRAAFPCVCKAVAK